MRRRPSGGLTAWAGLALLRALLLMALSLAGSKAASALPLYAQRSGRTCANCHESPTYEDPEGWENPALAWRKCNLSCGGCHTDPSGGGPRTVSGIYYGQSTLPMLPTQPRGYGDLERELVGKQRVAAFIERWDRPVSGDDDRHIPSDLDDVEAGVGQGQSGNHFAFGKPLGKPGRMAFWDGRYHDLSADPLLRVGGDLRGAWWSGNQRLFPMQLDLHGVLHPVEHVSVVGTLAGRGRAAGLEAILNDTRPPVFARRGFVMLHELPYFSWVKAGAFLPAFGNYGDDHTAFTREYVGLDVSQSESTVHGIELGAAPNYPVMVVSGFRTGLGAADSPRGDGWGATASLGWRDLGWSLVGHGMLQARSSGGGKDLEAAALTLGFNPFAWSEAVPLTYMGELVVGRSDGPLSDQRTPFSAWRHELWWTVRNGLVARFELDLGDREGGGPAAAARRLGLGLAATIVPGLTVHTQARHLATPGAGADAADVIVQTHVWF